MVLMCNYRYVCLPLCAYAHFFPKRHGCAQIGARALIRTNTVKFVIIEPKHTLNEIITPTKIGHF